MRFNVELLLENEIIPKDKNRVILSILKSCFSTYSKEYYNSLYEETKNKSKNFTFSLFMNNCKFCKEEIIIPERKIYLNFSTYDYENGIMFYNSFLTNKRKQFPVKNNNIAIGKINLLREKTIFSNEVVFKTMSPIVVREHKGNNKKTWYHSLSSEEGQNIFIENLKYQLRDVFGERVEFDFKDINVEISNDNKEVKVKNYGIEILSNIAKIRIHAQPYILDYLYKAGVGSKRSSGFGMVDIL